MTHAIDDAAATSGQTTLEVIEDVATLAAAGDTAALGELYEQYADPIYLWAETRLHDRSAAEGVAERTWLRVAEAITTYVTAGAGSFVGWLFAIARRALEDHRRLAWRRSRTDLPLTVLPQEDWLAIRDTRLVGALRRLPRKQRDAATLRFYVGLSAIETARVMDTTPARIRLLQHRALARLGGRL